MTNQKVKSIISSSLDKENNLSLRFSTSSVFLLNLLAISLVVLTRNQVNLVRLEKHSDFSSFLLFNLSLKSPLKLKYAQYFVFIVISICKCTAGILFPYLKCNKFWLLSTKNDRHTPPARVSF